PNSAFYEAFGADGMLALAAIIDEIPADIPVILDCKRGDIGATAEAYADAAYGYLRADAVTLNPYMGKDAISPFIKDSRKAAFVLVKTSNPGSADFQQLVVASGDFSDGLPCEEVDSLYSVVAKAVKNWSPALGAVVGATDQATLAKVRADYPDMWILCPGIGAQGGSVEDVLKVGLGRDGAGILPVVARGITQSDDPAAAAQAYCQEIRDVRDKLAAGTWHETASAKQVSLSRQICEGLVHEECFRVGEFRLKSGVMSPYYIDLRRVVTAPKLLRMVAQAYAAAVEGLDYDRIAGIPVAALPLATAVSLVTGKPMIYPRMEKKAHGTGNRIEGGFQPGEKILLLDDLITTGGSKLEAVEILREAGLVVEELVVLLERGTRGRKEMSEAGMRLHSCMLVDELFAYCHDEGIITPDQMAQMRSFTESV
ncbi:MAG: orotidine-5'-phosphate decarboxylase, partial [Spirochaetaceae bacterium]